MSKKISSVDWRRRDLKFQQSGSLLLLLHHLDLESVASLHILDISKYFGGLSREIGS